MPEKITPDLSLEEAVKGIIQGYPGAHVVLKSLKETFPRDDWLRMIRYLYEQGPRGHGLWERYESRCAEDALILGRDLLAQDQERRGWPQD